jgi:hypothetical protein
MKQESALNSRLLATTANASSRATIRVRKPWSLLAISIILILGTAADNTSAARYNDLGHRMMCTCDSTPAAMGPRGCRQVLLECNHVGCMTSEHMRGELRAALQNGDKDDAILQSFAQKYGATVLVSPSMTDINRLVWIMAFAVLAVTSSIVVAIVHKRQSRPSTVTSSISNLQGIDMDALRRRVREETEKDDW